VRYESLKLLLTLPDSKKCHKTKSNIMGKGDKKTRRGKIILGTYGVRRRRKKINKPEIKNVIPPKAKEIKEKKPLREKKEAPEVKAAAVETAEVKEVMIPKETRNT
jgi:ribosomal small subunit protein bTHX